VTISYYIILLNYKNNRLNNRIYSLFKNVGEFKSESSSRAGKKILVIGRLNRLAALGIIGYNMLNIEIYI